MYSLKVLSVVSSFSLQSSLHISYLILGLPFLYALGLVIYRLWVSPLANFPGPIMAAATGCYETYFDCLLIGKYTYEIEKMHEKYGMSIAPRNNNLLTSYVGPIVRISPWEIHIQDPEFFNEIYCMNPRLDKDPWYYRFVGCPDSTFATGNAQTHHIRRKPMSRLFSMAAVLRAQPLIEACVQSLITQLDLYKGTNTPAHLSHAYRCLAAETITQFSLHRSRRLLELPDFAPTFSLMFRTMAHIAIWHRHTNLAIPLLLAIPRWIVKRFDPAAWLSVLDFNRVRISRFSFTAR